MILEYVLIHYAFQTVYWIALLSRQFIKSKENGLHTIKYHICFRTPCKPICPLETILRQSAFYEIYGDTMLSTQLIGQLYFVTVCFDSVPTILYIQT